jgi:hypothetical protein
MHNFSLDEKPNIEPKIIELPQQNEDIFIEYLFGTICIFIGIVILALILC